MRYCILIILSIYTSSCAFNKSFYYPDKKPYIITEINYQEGFLTSRNGKKINYILAKPDTGEICANVLLLHGNASNLGEWSSVTKTLTKAGFQVLLIDYQGFGKSEGRPGHRTAYQDAEAGLKFLLSLPKPEHSKLIVLGYSLGGHLAVCLTANNQDKIDALVTEGAFSSHKDIGVCVVPLLIKPIARLFIYAPYKGKKLIRKIIIPKLIIHSTEDQVVPYKLGKRLAANSPGPVEFWSITGEHLDGLDYNELEYIRKIKALILHFYN